MSPQEDDKDRFSNGFAFFHKLPEILAWNAKDADVLQIANTPLYERPGTGDPTKCKIFVMHDYRGNYRTYEAAQGIVQDRKDYIMEYWQHVESFNYFSHRRISIPPAVWINAGHRNGVQVLGTFCIERYSKDDPRLIFEKYSSPEPATMKYKLPDIMAEMAKVYGFDGWLMNMESKIVDREDIETADRLPAWSQFSEAMLKEWVEQLKVRMAEKVPGGRVIWYDALDKRNRDFSSRNVLDEVNEPYRQAAGSILTNYFYNDTMLEQTFTFAGRNLDTVYHGIDCWGQTDDDPKGLPRGAWGAIPPGGRKTVGFTDSDELEILWGTGHGGTATGHFVDLIAQKLAKAKEKASNSHSTIPQGTGVGLFAHGWAYEHFMPGTSMDRFMWEGKPNLTPLIKITDSHRMKVADFEDKQKLRLAPPHPGWEAEYDCPCKTSIAQHLWEKPVDFKDAPIISFARDYPAGTKSFFHTDYTEPVLDTADKKYKFQVGQQSVLPIPGHRDQVLTFIDAGTTTGNLQAVMSTKLTLHVKLEDKGIKDTSKVKGSILLHKLDIDGSIKPKIVLVYRRLKDTTGLTIWLQARVGGHTEHWDLSGKATQTGQRETITEQIPLKDSNGHVTFLGIHVEGSAKTLANLVEHGTADLVDIISLTIKPQGDDYPDGKIAKADLEKKVTTLGTYHRLVWSLAEGTKGPDSLPWSHTTKQFSHFYIWANKQYLGVANALGFPISDEQVNAWKGAKVHFLIRGVTFDGSHKQSGDWEDDLGVPA